MTILTMARYEWFEEWAGTRAKHRGAQYQQYKMSIAQRLLERALQRFPHLRDKVMASAASPGTLVGTKGGCRDGASCGAGCLVGWDAPWA